VSHAREVSGFGAASPGAGSPEAGSLGADSETGTLRTVLVHRPGPELTRLTPAARDTLLFAVIPWAAGAQREHDGLTRALRAAGTEVLYVTELLQDVLEYQAAREAAIGSALRHGSARCPGGLGDGLAAAASAVLADLPPEDLAQALIAGLLPDDLPGAHGLAWPLLRRSDFVLDPLPNLVFTRDSSFWAGDRAAVASLAAPERRREADLLGVIYGYHPRFRGTKRLYGPELEPVDGGDVLLLAPGVLAVGVGQRTTPAGAERLARRVLEAGLAHTVLAIPVDQAPGGGYLDTLCTVIDAGTVLMHPATAYTLTAHAITARAGVSGATDGSAGADAAGESLRVSRAQPFLEAAAAALGIDRLQIIETGLGPGAGRRGQWDDGGNALVLRPGLVACHERSAATIARLETAGVQVVALPGSELAGRRGGPRGMACPVSREPAAEGLPAAPPPGRDLARLRRPLPGVPVTSLSLAPVSLARVSLPPVSLTPVSSVPAAEMPAAAPVTRLTAATALTAQLAGV
jgi:arginine deiminase